MSSVWTNNLKISIFGESHAEQIGAVIDNLPAGEYINLDEIKIQMRRRAPGNFDFVSQRLEKDEPKIISGFLNGRTTGAPLCAIIKNENYKSSDYKNNLDLIRPGHSDYSADVRYKGYNDRNGGGHLSGRLTAPIVFCGAICRQILKRKGILIAAHVSSIGKINDENFPIKINEELINRLSSTNGLSLINESLKENFIDEINYYKGQGDSIGGSVECAITGVEEGVGDPIFFGVENIISSLVFSIPGVKGIEFGSGFKGSFFSGSENNDEFFIEDGKIKTKTNNHGGILGGITSGMPIVFKVAVKPTPSIKKEQNTVNIRSLKGEKISTLGRHDPCIVPRVVPCVEAIAAISILDILLGAGKL